MEYLTELLRSSVKRPISYHGAPENLFKFFRALYLAGYGPDEALNLAGDLFVAAPAGGAQGIKEYLTRHMPKNV